MSSENLEHRLAHHQVLHFSQGYFGKLICLVKTTIVMEMIVSDDHNSTQVKLHPTRNICLSYLYSMIDSFQIIQALIQDRKLHRGVVITTIVFISMEKTNRDIEL